MTSDVESLRGPGLAGARLKHELEHISSHWWWLMLLGLLLVVSGTAAIISPPLTAALSLTVPIFLGVLLMIGGVATIVAAFWAGRWSAFFMELLVGILYLGAGLVMTDRPVVAAGTLTVFLAAMFIVLGTYRTLTALLLRYPQWGWGLLNGIITLLAGLVIYRNWPEDSLWVLGLLVGLEMLFNGWTWIMLSLMLRQLSKANA